jgi:hypothetical protein
MGWIIIDDDIGTGPAIGKGARTLGTGQSALEAEVAAIEESLGWFITFPVLAYDNTLRLNECDRSDRTYRARTWPATGHENPEYGCPYPPSLPDCGDHVGERAWLDTRKSGGGRTGREGSREVDLARDHLPD